MSHLLDLLDHLLLYPWSAHATIWYAVAGAWLLMFILCLRRPRKMR